jgi:hypothetical protein
VQWLGSEREADIVLLPSTQPSSVSSTPVDYAYNRPDPPY